MNKTQKVDAAKTAWVLKFGLLFLAGVLVVIASSSRSSMRILQVNGHSFTLEVADTVTKQELGLGGRASLPLNRGMLFVFDASNVRCFWMKDMHFPLDIIWVNEKKQIEFVKPDLSPNTYPQVFCPQTPAQYVIELNAGEAHQSDMMIGQILHF